MRIERDAQRLIGLALFAELRLSEELIKKSTLMKARFWR
jgi:hypothetical protein